VSERLRARQKRNLHKSSLRGEDDAQTSNTHTAHACAEKARDTTVNDEK